MTVKSFLGLRPPRSRSVLCGAADALTGAAALHLLFGAALALGLALDGVAWRDSFDSSTVSEVREAASATAAALS